MPFVFFSFLHRRGVHNGIRSLVIPDARAASPFIRGAINLASRSVAGAGNINLLTPKRKLWYGRVDKGLGKRPGGPI